MDFDKAVQMVLEDPRSKTIPILYIIEILIILEDKGGLQ